MSRHTHRFVETYNGLVGFGLDRETDGYTLTYYLQKFSDDSLMEVMRQRMSPEDMEALFNMLGNLLKKYLSDEEYHTLFLKE